MSHHERYNERVSALYQVSTFLVTLTLLAILFVTRYHSFMPHDPMYQLQQNTVMNKKYVTVGYHIMHFNKFFVSQNEFECDGTLWFIFDPDIVSLDTIKKFTIYNGELITVHKPILSKKENKTVAQFRIHLSFHTPLNYRLFPFDDHTLNIIIANNFFPEDVSFASSKKDITIDPALYLPGWTIMNKEARTGYTQAAFQLESEPAKRQEAVFTLSAERNDPMLAVNIFLTLLLMLFITLLTFSSDEDCVLIVTVGIVALVGYRVVMVAQAPNHISYFIFSDFVYLFALTGTILALLGGIVTRERHSRVGTKKAIIASIYGLFVVGCTLMSYIL